MKSKDDHERVHEFLSHSYIPLLKMIAHDHTKGKKTKTTGCFPRTVTKEIDISLLLKKIEQFQKKFCKAH